MKYLLLILSTLLLYAGLPAQSERAQNTTVLDEIAVANIGITTEVADYTTFDDTFFAIGRMAEIPASRAVVSSRIAGRVIELNAFEGDTVEAEETIITIESRQLGDPPPTVELRAPQGGLVVHSLVRLGEPVSPDAELLEIVDRSRMWAVAQVPETAASDLEIGTSARIRIPALGEEVILAALNRFGVDADPQAGTVEAIFEIDNRDGRLRPGMRAEFSIVLKSRNDVLAVPLNALQGDPARRIVYVKDFDLPHAFIRSPVVVGATNDQYAEIEQGVFPGDEVVVGGSYMLSSAGPGSGMSLKEALDAAHGHEHNEDGSEMTPEQRAARAAERAAKREGRDPNAASAGAPDPLRLPLLIYSGVCTILLVVAIQLLWNRHRREREGPHDA